jgi:hypothetical protein
MDGSWIPCIASSRFDLASDEGDGTPATSTSIQSQNMCQISAKARRGRVPVSSSICPLVMRRLGEGEELSESLFIASISAGGMRRLAYEREEDI